MKNRMLKRKVRWAIDCMFGVCCTLFVEVRYFVDHGMGYPLAKQAVI
jgi:hypothetical protein